MADANPTIDLLARTPLFANLERDVLTGVVRAMHRQEFVPGQLIFGRGDEGRDLFLIISGRVRLSVLSSEGRELSFQHAGPGDIFGEIAVLDDGPRTADAAAVGKAVTMALAAGHVRRLLAAHPPMANSIIRLLCQRLRDADVQLEGVALHRIEVRLARYLLTRAQAAEAAGSTAFDLGMSQSDLALLLGASRPKVNAALMLLEAEGALSRRAEDMVCEIDRLRDFAGLG